MILADSNIVIYARQKGYDHLRTLLANESVAACSVVEIEVLGWHFLEPADEEAFRDFFTQAVMYQLDEAVIAQTIQLKRQQPKMHLGDTIIAATALAYNLELWTANVEDFDEVDGLKLHNPLEASA